MTSRATRVDLVVLAVAVGLALVPPVGLAPASGWPASWIWLGWIKLVFAVPVTLWLLGVVPVRALGLAGGVPALALGCVVAPLVAAVVGAVGVFGDGSFDRAPWIAVPVGAIGVAAAWRSSRRATPATPGSATDDRRLLLVALLFAAAIALCFAWNPQLASRSDAWFHAAVTYRMDAVGWPPDDPYFVGIPLGYFWAFHLALGTLASLAGTTPFGGGVGWSLVAGLAVALWLGLLTRALCSSRAQNAALLLALFALNPFGWLFWLGRGLLGQDRGVDQLAAAWQGGTIAALEALSFRYLHPSVAYLGDKFLLVTALSLGFAAFLAFVWSLVQSPGAPAAVNIGRAALVVLSACVLHALVGGTLVAVAAVVLAGLAWRWAGERSAVFSVSVGVILGLAIALPYWLACAASRATPGVAWGVNPGMLWIWSLAGGVVAGLAVVEWLHWHREERSSFGRTASIAVAVVVVALGCVVTLYPHNETKLFQLGFLLLAVPAAGAWERALQSRWRPLALAGLLLLGVPTVAVATAGFLRESGADAQGTLHPPTHEVEAYRWLATHSHGSAGVVCNWVDETGQVDRDLLVHARRGLVWGGPQYATIWGYDDGELELRRSLAEGDALRSPSSAQIELLHRLDQEHVEEIYWLEHKSSGAPDRRIAESLWESRFENPEWRIWQFVPNTGGSDAEDAP